MVRRTKAELESALYHQEFENSLLYRRLAELEELLEEEVSLTKSEQVLGAAIIVGAFLVGVLTTLLVQAFL